MKQIGRVIVRLCVVLAVTGNLAAQELTLREVTLFTSGVAEFIATGEPDRDGALRLRVARDQMDDVIRSLTVIASDGSAVRGVSFPAGEEAARRLSRYAINLQRVAGIASLLTEARGASITVTIDGGRSISGRVVGASSPALGRSNGASGEEGELLLATDGRIRRIPLEQIGTLAFDDPDMQRDLEEALTIVGESEQPQAPRTIAVQLPAGVRGPVTVRYLREMPLWRTSYRAVVDGGRMVFQGWAHIDNVTASDWEGVHVSIVSARPVTYLSDLYTPEWVARGSAPRPAPSASQAYRNGGRSESAMAMDAFGEAAALDRSAVQVTAQTQALPAGVVFSFPDPVTIAAGFAAMVPIVQEEFAVERVRSYDPRRDNGNPRLSLSFENTQSVPLPGGIVTVYDDDRYAGDAVLSTLFPGGKATLPYAVDIDHAVTQDADVAPEELRSLRIVDGILLEEHRQRRTTRFRIERNGAGRPEPIEITIGIPSGWSLVSPTPIAEEGQDRTFRSSGSRLTITEERIRSQRVALTSADEETLLSYGNNRLIEPTIRRTLQNVIELRRQLEDARRRRQRVAEEIETIERDQRRIAQNMQALDQNSSLYRRYVRELDTQEDQIELLQNDLSDAQEEEREAEAALQGYIRTLD